MHHIRDLDQQIAERREQVTELQRQAGTSGSPTVSEPDEAAEATGTDSIYQLDLTTMQLQEVEVEVTEADIMAAAEQLAGAMLLGAGMFETEQQRDAALDAVQVEMLDIADTLDERYDVDRVRHEDVPAGYEMSTPAVVEHELPDDGGTGVHRHALMVLPVSQDAKEATTAEPADNTVDDGMQMVVGSDADDEFDISKDGKALSQAEIGHLVKMGCDRDKAIDALQKYDSVDDALSACIEGEPAMPDAGEASPSPEVKMAEAADRADTAGQDTVTAGSDTAGSETAETAADDKPEVVSLISPGGADSADVGATEAVGATGTPGDGKAATVASPEPAVTTTGIGGSSGQEGDKVPVTVAQPEPAGARLGKPPAGSTAIKPEGPKNQSEAVRQLIEKAEEVLVRPVEKNENEYGKMYDWLSKAMQRLLPDETGWKAVDPQSARLCLGKLKSVEARLSDSGAAKRGRSPKDEGVGTKVRRIMTLGGLLEQLGLYDEECKDGRLLRDVLQEEGIDTVDSFRLLSREDLCTHMKAKMGQWQRIAGWMNAEGGPEATTTEARQGEPGAVQVEPVGNTAMATEPARATGTSGAGGKTDAMFAVLMETGVNKVLPDIGQLYGGNPKLDVALNDALSEQEVKAMFGKRLALGEQQRFEIKLTDLSYLKKTATEPDPGTEVDLTFGIDPDSKLFRPLVREAAATFDCMQGVQEFWTSKLRTAESKAVAAVESAEKSAGAKREANTGTTATLQGRLTKAQLALREGNGECRDH